jgi:hypothetical protein
MIVRQYDTDIYIYTRITRFHGKLEVKILSILNRS